jgi:iron complex outermembrane receptor protein
MFTAVGLACLAIGQQALADATSTDDAVTLPEVEVHGQSDPAGQTLGSAAIDAGRARSSDTIDMLTGFAGFAVHGAGGFSALPVYHGMADDRLLVRADGVTVPSSCPNHMNSPLSYVDPNTVASIRIYNGTAPVSLGGDNIGGVIVVDSAAPLFSDTADTLTRGDIGAYFRSNGKATGAHASATIASDKVSITYSGSVARSDDYDAAQSFKSAGQAASGRGWLNGDTVGSSAYKTENQQLTVATRGDRDLFEVQVGVQHAPYEGFANQRMDMTGNDGYQVSTHYNARYDWGTLDAKLYDQYVRHSMQFGDDKQYVYGSYVNGMPMETASHTQGAAVSAALPIWARDTLKVGSEIQHYRLDDWWPAAGGTGGMGPNTFWNINNGQRNRFDLFGELDHVWSDTLHGTFGSRLSTVNSNAGDVQGYNTTSTYASDAAAFNALNRQRTDHNIDLSAQLDYTPSTMQSYELGLARKTRSPNLYERYAWSTMSMAAVMNNTAGDGNGYFGNPDLKPEVANTASLTSSWHDADNDRWSLRLAPYYSYVQNYIDAARCGTTACGGTTNLTRTTGYVTLQYVNQTAEIYGVDLDGKVALARSTPYGRFDLTGKISYARGKNLTTGDNLYNIMPLNGTFAIAQSQGPWTNTIEALLVSAKKDVSQVRDEVQTPGYSLLNVRTHYQWHKLGINVGIDNLLNRFYYDPLGGAYTGQGMTMSKSGIPWGVGVPGPARTYYTSFDYAFD